MSKNSMSKNSSTLTRLQKSDIRFFYESTPLSVPQIAESLYASELHGQPSVQQVREFIRSEYTLKARIKRAVRAALLLVPLRD